MPRTLCGGRPAVLEKCFRRSTGERAELGDQVGLVREPALERELGPAHRSGKRARTLEPDEPRNGFRQQTDLIAERRDEPLPAPAELLRKRADAHAALRTAKLLPRPHDGRRRPGP